MQALNIQTDLITSALNLQSAPSKNTQDNSVSFASLVSSEIDKAKVTESKPVESNSSASKSEQTEKIAKADENSGKVAESAKSDTKDVEKASKESSSKDAEKAIAENVEDNSELSESSKEIEERSVATEKKVLAKASKDTKKISDSASSKDKKSVKAEKETDSNENLTAEKASQNALSEIASANAAENTVVENAVQLDENADEVAEVASVQTLSTQKTESSLQNDNVELASLSEEGEELVASAVENLSVSNSEEKAGDNSEKSSDNASKDNSFASKQSVSTKKGASLTVRDERTEKVAEVSTQKNGAENVEIKAVGDNAVELSLPAVTVANANITSSNSQTAGAIGSNYQSMLANQIQNNAPEFVKAGSIVLRDNNQGAINLILHPESLGNVKVSLQLTDKIIAGQIVVQSQEAYNAFRDSIDSLKQAFAQNGFETANFNLAMGGDMMNGNGGNHDGRADAPFIANRAYGDYAESVISAEGASATYAGSADGVDIVA